MLPKKLNLEVLYASNHSDLKYILQVPVSISNHQHSDTTLASTPTSLLSKASFKISHKFSKGLKEVKNLTRIMKLYTIR